MQVKCIVSYYDLIQKKSIKVGEVFEVSKERAQELATSDNKVGFPLVVILENDSNVKSDDVETSDGNATKKRTRKKKEDKQ